MPLKIGGPKQHRNFTPLEFKAFLKDVKSAFNSMVVTLKSSMLIIHDLKVSFLYNKKCNFYDCLQLFSGNFLITPRTYIGINNKNA